MNAAGFPCVVVTVPAMFTSGGAVGVTGATYTPTRVKFTVLVLLAAVYPVTGAPESELPVGGVTERS